MAEPESSRTDRGEIASAIVIALSGLLIAFASYQSELWGGEENLNLSRANILYTQAARTWSRSNTQQAVELQLFSRWMEADAHGDAGLARLYASRVPSDARAAFQAWQALRPQTNPAAPPSPLAMPQYAPAGPAQAKALESKGDEGFKEGRHARRISDSFSQAGTILSTALFCGGIGQTFRGRAARGVLLALSTLACGLGILRLLTLPLMMLGST
jgi:hypothetical protein